MKKSILLLGAIFLWNCAANKACPQTEEHSSQVLAQSLDDQSQSEVLSNAAKARVFKPVSYNLANNTESSPLDSLFNRQSILVSSFKVQQNRNLEDVKAKGHYIIQFEAVADFDAAQKRRRIIEKKTGYGVYLTFVAPFYKLRGGGWDSREDAEDAAHKLLDLGLGGYVIKL
jgi:hypothetical protein